MLSFIWQWVSFISPRSHNFKNPDKRRAFELFLGSLAAPWLLKSASEALLICCLGRMVWNYIPDAKIYQITAWRFSTYFVILDIM